MSTFFSKQMFQEMEEMILKEREEELNKMFQETILKEKEKLKEEHRKIKKLEQNFKNLLKKIEINETTKFEEIKEKLVDEEAYQLINSDQDRERIFAEYLAQMQETCLHHIKKIKKEKPKNKRSRSKSTPPNNNDDSDDTADELAVKSSKKENSKTKDLDADQKIDE